MDKKVLILGSCGMFGQRICFALAKAGINIIIAGRNDNKVNELEAIIASKYPNAKVKTAVFDAYQNFNTELLKLKPAVVINTCGPFQNASYSIAEICIQKRIHYIDLADDRDFVSGIHVLDEHAKRNSVLVVSGASTVPGLSSAVLEKYKGKFSQIESLIFGITPGGKTQRGLATTQSVLSYLGKPLKPYPSYIKKCYGWQNIYCQNYPEIGKRWMANCDIPDLELLPERYDMKHIQFSAGMESRILHFGIWIMSWLVRLGLPIQLKKYAKFFLYISHWFDWMGTQDGGMHMLIKGKDNKDNIKEIQWFIIAKDGDGPQIPCVPAVILAKKLLAGDIKEYGAMACMGLITLEEYMQELDGFAIEQHYIEKT